MDYLYDMEPLTLLALYPEYSIRFEPTGKSIVMLNSLIGLGMYKYASISFLIQKSIYHLALALLRLFLSMINWLPSHGQTWMRRAFPQRIIKKFRNFIY